MRTPTLRRRIGVCLIASLTVVASLAILPGSAAAGDDGRQDQDTTSEGKPDHLTRSERRAERLATLTEVLGVGEEILRAARQAGESLADVAEAQGVPVDDVVAALVADKADRLAERVAAGELTQEEADARLERAASCIENRVNGEGHERGRRQRGHRGGKRDK